MRSQESFYLLQSAHAIRVAIATDGDRVGTLLNEQLSLPPGEDKPVVDYRRNFRQLSTRLDGAMEAVRRRLALGAAGHLRTDERFSVSTKFLQIRG